MKISFFDCHGKLAYNPNTEKNAGVGAVETTLIQSAKAIAEKGHDVTVYNNCNFPDIYDGVKYYKYSDYKPAEEDVLIGFENFPNNYNAKKLVNWVTRFYPDEIEKYPNVDKVFVSSQWQKDFFASSLSSNLIEKMVVIPQGVDKLFMRNDIKDQDFNITYAGHPSKGGMEAIIPIAERMKPKIPQIVFHVYGGGGLWGWNNEQYRPLYNNMIKKGILYHGQLGKEEMTIKLAQAQIFIYPVGNHYKETFGLAVLEAMAAGCVVITNNNGNLKSLIGDRGFVIEGDIKHYMWSMEVVEKIVQLYGDMDLMTEISTKAKEFAKDYTWEKTAELCLAKLG
jgi:glycosyltransferase involved in cell wall biosynthesis